MCDVGWWLSGRVSAVHSVVAGSIFRGGDHGILCWWDLIRSKQLSSVSVCHAQVFTRFSGYGNSIHTRSFVQEFELGLLSSFSKTITTTPPISPRCLTVVLINQYNRFKRLTHKLFRFPYFVVFSHAAFTDVHFCLTCVCKLFLLKKWQDKNIMINIQE